MSEDTKPTDNNEEPKKGILSIFESNKAKDAQKLVAAAEKVTELDAENTTLHQEVARLQSVEKKQNETIESLQSEKEQLQKDKTELEKQLKESEQSAGKKAAQIAAQSHKPASELPDSDQSGGEDPMDAIITQLNETDDPREKGRLAAKLTELRNNQN